MASVIRGGDNFDSAVGVIPAGVGAVGTYAFCMHTGGGVTQGSTYAGSSLYAGGLIAFSTFSADTKNGGTDTMLTYGGSALSGTWRAMGRQQGEVGKWTTTLFVRIS